MGQTHAAWITVHTGTERHREAQPHTHTHRRIHAHTHRHKPRSDCLSAYPAQAGAHPLASLSHQVLSGAPSMAPTRRPDSSPARKAAKLSDALPRARAQPAGAGVEARAPEAAAAGSAPKATAAAASSMPELPSGDTAARCGSQELVAHIIQWARSLGLQTSRY
jgi:hypothetical protein